MESKERTKYKTINLKSKKLHKEFISLKVPGDYKNHDEIMFHLLREAKKAEALREENKKLRSEIEEKDDKIADLENKVQEIKE
jgi:predicted RNase H-like nuclease (RuvC/YqgF family)